MCGFSSMAKSTSTPAAGPASPAPAAAPAAAQGAAAASPPPGAGTPGVKPTQPAAPRHDPLRTAPEVQADDGYASLNNLAAQLAGLDEAPNSPAPKKPAKAKLTPPPDSDEDDDDDDLDPAARDQSVHDADDTDPDAAPASDSFDPDAPVLSDEDEDADGEAGDEDDAEGAAEQDTEDPKGSKLKSENFKLREAKRQLKTELEDTRKRLDDLEAKLATVPQSASTTPTFDGYFAQVSKVEDIPAIESRLQADLDYLDDNPDGYSYTDQTTGQEVEVTRAQVRELKRNLQTQLRQAPKVLDALTKHQTRAQEADTLARKKYPFVFDPKAKLNERVLDAAKEFPELTRSPSRALALGRLAIGQLVESGEYMLVKRSKAAAPSHSAAPSRRTTSSAPPPIQGRNGHRQTAPQDGLGERISRGDRNAMEEAALAMITPSK